MRVFGIESDGTFREYVRNPFQTEHDEALLESWLEGNPDAIVEGQKLLIVGRQVPTNLGGFMDLFALDEDGNAVVIELKKGRTPRDTLAQALEYASYAEQLDAEKIETFLRSHLDDDSVSLSEYHRSYFGIDSDQAVSFNKTQRIVIVGERITPEITQTASFLRVRGLDVNCVEFAFFKSDAGTNLFSQETIVGREGPGATPQPVTTFERFMNSLDENGRTVFGRIFEFAKERGMPIHWGTKGFSFNADVAGTHVPICYGYPPASVWKQSLYTAWVGAGGLKKKTAIPDSAFQILWNKAEETGLFVQAGQERKCPVNRAFSEQEISALLSWLESAAATVVQYGLK